MKPEHYIVTTVRGNTIDIIQGAEALSETEKVKLYLEEWIWRMVNNKNFNVDITNKNITFRKTEIQYDLNKFSFNSFCSKDNVIEINHGSDWRERKFATESRIEFTGLYKSYLHTK